MWRDKSRNAPAVQVTKDGYKPQFQIVKTKQGQVSTVDFMLDTL